MSKFMRWLCTGIFSAILAGLVFLLATFSIVVCIVLFILIFVFVGLGLGRGGRSRIVVVSRPGARAPQQGTEADLRALSWHMTGASASSRTAETTQTDAAERPAQREAQRQAEAQAQGQTQREAQREPQGQVYDLSTDEYTVEYHDKAPAASAKEEASRK